MRDEPSKIVQRGYDLVSLKYCPSPDPSLRPQYGPWPAELGRRLKPGAHVLDLGCGCGVPVSLEMSRAHTVTGIDICRVQVDRARELVPQATFRRADMTCVTFEPESWDAIVALYSLIHVPLQSQRALLKRVAGWLRPGEKLLVSGALDAWTGTEES